MYISTTVYQIKALWRVAEYFIIQRSKFSLTSQQNNYTRAHTHGHTHTGTHTWAHTHTNMATHKNRHTHMGTCTHTQPHTQMDTHWHTYWWAHKRASTHTQLHSYWATSMHWYHCYLHMIKTFSVKVVENKNLFYNRYACMLACIHRCIYG